MHAHVSAILVLLSIHTFPSLTSFPTSIAPVLCTFVTTAALSHARHKTVSTIANSIVVYPRVDYCSSLFPNFESRAYFKQDLQLHKAWRSANGQYNNCTFHTAHFDFTTAQIVINCTLKYSLTYIILLTFLLDHRIIRI